MGATGSDSVATTTGTTPRRVRGWERSALAASRRLTVSRVLWIVMIVGVAWRALRYALAFPIWGDEAFVAVSFITRGYADMLRPLEYGQIVPLVFMWAELAVSRVAGLSEWALRLLPSLAGMAAVLLFWRFAATVLPRRAALLALSFFGASSYVVRHGAEVKPYITDLLVSLGLTMLAWGLWNKPRSAVRWVGLVILAGAGVWCSYPSAFVAGAAGLVLLCLVVRERFRTPLVIGLVVYGLVLLASFAAMYVTYARPHAAHAARLTEIDMWAQTFPPLSQPGKLPLWLLAIHTGLMMAYPHGGANGGSVLTTILAAIGAVRLWRTQRSLLLLLLGPLALTFAAAAMRAYPYGGSARTSLYMAPAFCLLAGLGLSVALRRLLNRDRLRIGWQVAALAPATFAIGMMINDVVRPYQSRASYESHRAVRAIARQTRADDRWIVFNATRRVDYAPYLGDWRGVGGQFVFDILRFAPVPLSWAPPACDVGPARTGAVWLLAYRADSAKVVFPADQLAAYLEVVSSRLGPPQHTSYSVKRERNKVESVEAYRFGAP